MAENQETLLINPSNRSQKQNMSVKFFHDVPVFFRGLESKAGVKSLSADASIYDELDESDQSQVAQAKKRMSASDIKFVRELSTPTLPDYGINRRFQESDQHYYAFKCDGCSHFNILEQTFPNCFKQDRQGNYYRACSRCQKDITHVQGVWAQTERSDLRGYHISQLYSPFVKPNDIMKEYQTTQFISHFYNHVIGVPYLNSTDRVTENQVLELCNPMLKMAHESISPTVMGIDQGSKLHCVIIQKQNLVRWVGELDHFEQVDALVKRFNIKSIVIDAMPETRKARELSNRLRGKVWLNWYNDNQKGSYAWKEDERQVSVNRTESLDVGTDLILNQGLKLPQRSPEIEMFAKHCSNIAKVAEENPITGSKKYVYKKIGPDHYRHALNYALIAQSATQHSGVVSVTR